MGAGSNRILPMLHPTMGREDLPGGPAPRQARRSVHTLPQESLLWPPYADTGAPCCQLMAWTTASHPDASRAPPFWLALGRCRVWRWANPASSWLKLYYTAAITAFGRVPRFFLVNASLYLLLSLCQSPDSRILHRTVRDRSQRPLERLLVSL